jgi:hypothetical protein
LKTISKRNYDDGDGGDDNDDEKELTIFWKQQVKKDPYLTITGHHNLWQCERSISV